MLKQPCKTISQKIEDITLKLNRTAVMYNKIRATFPADIDAEIRYFDDINIWITLEKGASVDDCSKVIEWASLLYGNGGTRYFNEGYGEFRHKFNKTMTDEYGSYIAELVIDDYHPDNCEIIEKVETRTVFEAKCRGGI